MAQDGKGFNILADKLKSGIKAPNLNLRLPKIVTLIIVVLAVIVVVYNAFLKYVEPNEFGIKQVKIALSDKKRGIQEKPYLTGLHFIIPVFQRMHYLPRDIQVLELTNYPQTASQFSTRERAAHIQTSDGFFVDVDVSILYHIADPYKVFTKIGPGNLFETNGIIPKAEPVLKETLGELTTEEFYNSPLRVQKTLAAREKLNQELQEKGLVVDYVLVRYFQYSEEIQKNIEEKKLKDQLVFKNQAEARAAIEEATLKRIEQEGKVIVSVEFEKGNAYVTKKNAEKDLYARKKRADANLLVKLADAEKIRLKNEALRGKGAERMVGLKMADAYKGLDIVILPSDGPSGVNPLDLDSTLKLFDVRSKGGAR
ncbi:MAG: SPFH domain-containing protein [Deltaproteobacteria bacterium]|nr:SPFH domain-containing protein [Deltaproteobacteria bacterium]